MTGDGRPPRLAEWLLRLTLPPGIAGDSMRGDLLEEWRACDAASSTRTRRYWRQALSLMARYGPRRIRVALAPTPSPTLADTGSAPMGFDSVWRDMRYAVRSYIKAPSFTLAVLATLALGIGASTAIFSLVNGILLQPLPLREPDRLVYVNEMAPNGNLMSVSFPNFLDWVQRVHTVESIALSREEPLTLTGVDRPQRLRGRRITASFMSVIGAAPVIGRTFSADADQLNATAEALVSDGFWRTRLGADPAVVGRTLLLDNFSYTIVGVMPRGFQYIRPYDVFVSLGPMLINPAGLRSRGNHQGFSVVARLRPGSDVAAADREFKAIAASLEREYPNTNAGVSARAEMLSDRLVSDIKLTLVALFGAVGFLLLIACVNVANLLIARGAARQRELAVRAALGGGRLRLVRQLLVESTLVSALGGLLGVVVATGLLRALVAVAPEGTPRIETVQLDALALAFAFTAAAICGLVFGLFPAFQASRADSITLLRARSGGAAAGAHRVRRALIVVETALAIVLLIGAGLTMRTLQELTRVDTGFHADHLLTMRVNLAGTQWTEPRRRNFYDELSTRVRALPGVTKAALAFSLPIEGSQWNSVFIAADKPEPVRAQTPSAAFSPVGIGYFETLGMRIARGRVFDDRDRESGPRAVVVNEALAQRIWPGEDAVGKRLKQGWFDTDSPWAEVIGVVANVRFEGVTAETPMQVYVPLAQNPSRSVALIARVATDPATLVPAVEEIVRSLDKDLPLFAVRTMDEMMDASIARQRMAMVVFVVFAVVALALASVGLYGVVAHGVTERTHEIGVRMALGAERHHVLGLVVRQGLTMAVLGIAVGVGGALALSRTIEGILFGVKPTDPLTFATVIGTLLLVATIACVLPARRATRLDPTQALRAE